LAEDVTDEGLAELQLVEARQVGTADQSRAEAEGQDGTEVETVRSLLRELPLIGLDGGGVATLELVEVVGRRLDEMEREAGGRPFGDIDADVDLAVPAQPLADHDEGALGVDLPFLRRLAEIVEGADVGGLARNGIDALVVGDELAVEIGVTRALEAAFEIGR